MRRDGSSGTEKTKKSESHESDQLVKKLKDIHLDLLDQCCLFQKRMKIFNKEKAKLDIIQQFTNQRTERVKPYQVLKYTKKAKAAAAIIGVNEYRIRKKAEKRIIMERTNVLNKRYCLFQSIIKKLMLHERFILEAISLLPKDYIKARKGHIIEGLIERLKSLFLINDILFKKLEKKDMQLKMVHQEVIQLTNEQDVLTVILNSAVKEMVDKKEETKEIVHEAELAYYNMYTKTRDMVKNFGSLIISLNNIANKCISAFKIFEGGDVIHTRSPLLKKMHVDMKIMKIQEYLLQNLEIVKRLSETEDVCPSLLKIVKYCKL